MKIYQIRGQSTEELKITLKESYETLENLKFQHVTGHLENYKSLANTKKDIAKILTVLKERESGIESNRKEKNTKRMKNNGRK